MNLRMQVVCLYKPVTVFETAGGWESLLLVGLGLLEVFGECFMSDYTGIAAVFGIAARKSHSVSCEAS